MSNPTPRDVWNAVLSMPEMAEETPERLELIRPFVEALPTVLSPLLEQQITTETLMRAKAMAKRYALNNGWVDAVAKGFEGAVVVQFEGWGPEDETGKPTDVSEAMVVDKDDLRRRLEKEIAIYDSFASGAKQFMGHFPPSEETIAERLRTSPWDFMDTPEWAEEYLE